MNEYLNDVLKLKGTVSVEDKLFNEIVNLRILLSEAHEMLGDECNCEDDYQCLSCRINDVVGE